MGRTKQVSRVRDSSLEDSKYDAYKRPRLDMSYGPVYTAEDATDQLSNIISTLTRDTFSPEVIEDLIIHRGANPNVRSKVDGLTLLLKLSLIGKNEVDNGIFHQNLLRTFIFLLRRPGIDVTVLASGGNMLITKVTGMEDPRFLSLLLENSEDARRGINALTHPTRGMAAIHFSCESTNIPIQNIHSLLMYGANPNMKCPQYGRTPLQYLMRAYGVGDQINKLIAILNLFFRYPGTRLGDHNLRDNNGCTLLHYAANCIHSRVVIDMLLRKGESRSLNVRELIGGFSPMNEAIHVNNQEAITAIQMFLYGRISGG